MPYGQSRTFIPKGILGQKDIKHGNGVSRFVFRKVTGFSINDGVKWARSGQGNQIKATVVRAERQDEDLD